MKKKRIHWRQDAKEKRCTICLKLLPRDNFYYGKRFENGRPSCKKCSAADVILRKNLFNTKDGTLRIRAAEFPIYAFRAQIASVLKFLSNQVTSSRAIIEVREIDQKRIEDKTIEFWLFKDTEGNKMLYLVREKKLYPIDLLSTNISDFMISKNIIFHARMRVKFDLLPDLTNNRTFADLGFSILRKKYNPRLSHN